MPYTDKNKEKAYYERHKKHYDKKFIDENRDEWNEYQRNYKVQQRIDHTNQIKQLVKELNIAGEDEIGFEAAVVCLIMVTLGISSWWAIAYRTGYSLDNIKFFIDNWKKSGLFDGKHLHMDEYKTDLELCVTLALMSLCGCGEVVAIQVEEKMPPKKPILIAASIEKQTEPYQFYIHPEDAITPLPQQ